MSNSHRATHTKFFATFGRKEVWALTSAEGASYVTVVGKSKKKKELGDNSPPERKL